MQWDEFLRQEAATHELSPEQTAAFLVRLQTENLGKSEAKLASNINIGAAAFKKRMTEVYDKFAQSCPELATSKRGKLETLKAYLTAKYNGIPHTPQITKEIHHNIPWSGVVEFVGRETELQNLHRLLQENQQVAIAGMGGVGKTELALRYANQHRETYMGGICWLLPKSGDVGIQIVQFARTHLDLNIPEGLTENPKQKLLAQVQYCWRHWPQGEALLVLDDVRNYEEVKPYLPPSSSQVKVLMTTRLYFGGIKQLSLDVLQPEAALDLLKSLLLETPERVERELAVAKQLCEWLGYLPLGLELVGRYLARKRDLSVTEILQRLKAKRLDERSLSKSKSEANMTAQRGVLAAFELSWQELEEEDKQLGCLLSLFAAAPIPWYLVEQCLPEKEKEDLEDIRDDQLLNFHLLQRKGNGIYQLHTLLREFFQYKLRGLEQAEEFKRSFCGVVVKIAKKIPKNPIFKQIKVFFLVIPHIAEVANHLIQYINDEDLIWPFIANARFYDGQGLYIQAEPWYKKCLEFSEKHFGKEHRNFASSLNNLALLYHSQGRYSEAEPLYRQALELARHLLGEENLDVASSLNNLAALYHSQGRYSKAEPIYLQALALRLKLLGEENLDVASSLNSLAEFYRSQGRYSEAEPLYIEALILKRKLLKEENPDIALSLNNLALLYYSQGKYSEAEPLYLQALKVWRHLLSEEHPNVASSLNNLAVLYYVQGRYSEAEPLYLQALTLRRHLLGEKHPDIALSLNNLAGLYRYQGRYSEAEPLFLQALELWRCLLGEKHPDVALSLNNLAEFYSSQGRYSEAETLYIKALDIFEQRLEANHPYTVTCRDNLANLRDRLNSQQ
ncbi:NB-ARC domain-containing protein [Calothrix sp. NIES-2100]|uniref:tetratricopeptide repeat protein n=1 Tax=Calothrix sp. NIES-2100 TaxID=1954172 RepID=UPI000B5F31C0|nr:NB-ARC domain-containing protein [Calothrix sp. NIES-2100]